MVMHRIRIGSNLKEGKENKVALRFQTKRTAGDEEERYTETRERDGNERHIVQKQRRNMDIRDNLEL
jgi:hypothetical protein